MTVAERFPHRWTKESAKAANRASIEARQRYAKLRRQLPDLLLGKLIEAQHNALLSENGTVLQSYQAERLIRVRKHLDRIDKLIKAETDTKRLKELADASTRLSEQERILSGRPMPGSLRPEKPSKVKPPSSDLI